MDEEENTPIGNLHFDKYRLIYALLLIKSTEEFIFENPQNFASNCFISK